MSSFIVNFVETKLKDMDVQAAKLRFIEQYLKVDDESIIEKLYNTLREELSNKRISLSNEEKAAIDRGLDDVKNGRVLSGDQVKDRLRKKYPNLIK
jgi:predicted transcriptional regulator